jgi:glycosyltransferase involved in cell wall biosynthesis
MKTISVLIDVSFAAGQHVSGSSTGVGRVVDEIVKRLVEMDRLKVRVTGLYSHDLNPALTDRRVRKWAKEVLGASSLAISAYRSQTGLSALFRPLTAYLDDRNLGHSTQFGFRYLVLQLMSRALRKLSKADSTLAISQEEVDVLVMTFLPPPEGLSKELTKVVFVHDVYPLRYPNECSSDLIGNLSELISGLCAKRDFVVTNSEFTKRDFCNYASFPPERVFVCHLAADGRFQPTASSEVVAKMRQRYRVPPGPYFLTVANPQPRKNLVTAVRAFGKFVEAHPAWKGSFVLAGNAKLGWGEDAFDRFLSGLGPLGERFCKTGPVAESDLPTLYSGAIGFVFPSLFEGFGLPVLEAMKCGVPVVASSATSIPEVGGDAAIYCDPYDIEGFANAMAMISTENDYRNEMIRKGFEQSSRFSWDASADAFAMVVKMASDQGNHS